MDGPNHAVRQKAHLLLLSNRGFSPTQLSRIFVAELYSVRLIIEGWHYFGEDVLLINDENKLKELIDQARRENSLFWRLVHFTKRILRKTAEIVVFILLFPFFVLQALAKKTWYYLSNSVWWMWGVIAFSFGKLLNLLKGLNFNKFYIKGKEGLSNTIKIGKDSSNNKIIQIINNAPHGESLNYKKIEELISNSHADLLEKMRNILNQRQDIGSSDIVLALAFAFNEKVQRIKSQAVKRQIVSMIAVFVIMYLSYYGFIKSGVVCVSIFSVVIPIINLGSIAQNFTDFQSWIVNQQLLTKNNVVVTPDTLSNEEHLKLKEPDFIPLNDCPNLSLLDRIFIEQDTTNYFDKNYFVGYPDNRHYLHVAVYNHIEEAAFQRLNLLNNGFSSSKIVRRIGWTGYKYYVTIADFKPSQVFQICSTKQYWDNFCFEENSKAAVIFNE